ncbi:beta-4C adrenergic receptor [Biomphalaria glabrata]
MRSNSASVLGFSPSTSGLQDTLTSSTPMSSASSALALGALFERSALVKSKTLNFLRNCWSSQ